MNTILLRLLLLEDPFFSLFLTQISPGGEARATTLCVAKVYIPLPRGTEPTKTTMGHSDPRRPLHEHEVVGGNQRPARVPYVSKPHGAGAIRVEGLVIGDL